MRKTKGWEAKSHSLSSGGSSDCIVASSAQETPVTRGVVMLMLSPRGKEGVGQPCGWHRLLSENRAALWELRGKSFISTLIASGSLLCEGVSS